MQPATTLTFPESGGLDRLGQETTVASVVQWFAICLMPRLAGNGDNVPIVSSGPLVPFDAGKPSHARAYDYFLGGKDNFAADRDLATKMLEVFPLSGVLARENRQFLARAVDYVSGQGVRQFIDVGAGLPASPSTHEVAGQVSPDARVVYVDNDPVVISHATALPASRNHGRVAAVPGDVRDPDAILASPGLTAVIDLDQPFCVILGIVLDFVEPAAAAGITAAFRRAMPAGSFLVISNGINNNPDLARRVIQTYTAGTVHVHSRDQIAGYFDGLQIVEPGLTEARHWRPPPAQIATGLRTADVLAGVARKVPLAG
jgi:S-adenosyl methyltransferase